MRLADDIQLNDYRKTSQGFLDFASARLSRTGIQVYKASELSPLFDDLAPDSPVKVYRSEEEVFSEDSLASLAGLPITISHGGGFVDAANAGNRVVGFVGESVTRAGDFSTGRVRIHHSDGIQAVESGIRELSVGYKSEVLREPGSTPSGETYDAIATKIRGNHVALVARGRCGPECRVHDGANSSGECKCQENRMGKKITINGITLDCTDEVADGVTALGDAHTAALAVKDEEIAARDEKIVAVGKQNEGLAAKLEAAEAKLKDAEAKLTPEALDAAAAERATLIADAHKLAPKLDCAKKTPIEIKRAALEAMDVDLEGKEDVLVDAAFDARVEIAGDGKTASQRAGEGLAGGGKKSTTVTDSDKDPVTAYKARMSDAYKGAA